MRFLLGNWGYNENKAISFMVSPLKTTQIAKKNTEQKKQTELSDLIDLSS